jgi:N-acyl-D-amino-acid deacylase
METPTRTVIQNAYLVDGSGSPAMHADIAFEGDFITDVAAPQSLPTPSTTRVIDADGRLVTPGWVDIHTHYDAQATWDPWLTPSSWHGVTSVVMGNCGVGFAPASSDRHDWLIALMEGVEDIPGTAMTEGITWEWTSFEEYLTALESRPHVIDFAAQIAHGPLRGYVMGDRGAANETATADDIEQMSKLVESALRAGALGFSTSRTPLHRSKDGELVPGTTANEHELLGIAGAMKRVGHGVFQFAPEHAKVPVEEWSWMRKLAQTTGATVSVNLSQPNDGPEIWRNVLALAD